MYNKNLRHNDVISISKPKKFNIFKDTNQLEV